MFWPAVGQAYDDMVDSGYKAMRAFKGKMIKKVGHRVPNYPALKVLWALKVLEVWVFTWRSLLVAVLLLLLRIVLGR